MDDRYTVEELLLDESFLNYCIDKNSIHKNKWEQIILEYPDQLKTIEEAKELFFLLNPSLSPDEIAAEVNKVREIILSRRNVELPMPGATVPGYENIYVDDQGRLRGRRAKKLLLYGIMVSAISLGVIYFINSGKNNKVEETGLTENRLYQSSRAERKQIELPDGSEVILNANSSISISAEYNKKTREVQLSGDAFFKVVRNAGKPFIVLTPAFSTEALGTSFYVHGRDKNKNYSVELLEGNVKLLASDAGGGPTYLNPGEGGQWKQAESAFTKYNFDTSALKKWVSGKISFNKTPVQQAIIQLEKWYAVDIDLQRNNLRNIPITGEYDNSPLDDVLKIICFTLSCQYKYSGDKIIIQ